MKAKAWTEKFMQGVFFIAACASVLAVALICVFLFANGIPAMKEIGFIDFITGDLWKQMCIRDRNQTGAVYAAVPYGDFYVLACGSGGVQVLDKELQLVDTYETQGAVKDIKTYGEYLYTAESGCGLGVYRLHGSQLEKIGSCNTTVTKKNLTSIEITSDGRYIVGQGGWTSVVTFDVSDPTAPYQAGAYETGSMYYRNVVSLSLIHI